LQCCPDPSPRRFLSRDSRNNQTAVRGRTDVGSIETDRLRRWLFRHHTSNCGSPSVCSAALVSSCLGTAHLRRVVLPYRPHVVPGTPGFGWSKLCWESARHACCPSRVVRVPTRPFGGAVAVCGARRRHLSAHPSAASSYRSCSAANPESAAARLGISGYRVAGTNLPASGDPRWNLCDRLSRGRVVCPWGDDWKHISAPRARAFGGGSAARRKPVPFRVGDVRDVRGCHRLYWLGYQASDSAQPRHSPWPCRGKKGLLPVGRRILALLAHFLGTSRQPAGRRVGRRRRADSGGGGD